VDVAFVGGGADDCAVDFVGHAVEDRWNRHEEPVAGSWIPNQEVEMRPVDCEDAAVAAAEDDAVGAVETQREARGGHAVRRVQRGGKLDLAAVEVVGEEAEEGRFPVAAAEAAEEMRVGDEAAPLLADEGGAGERGRLRRKAEEVLAEQILIFKWGT